MIDKMIIVSTPIGEGEGESGKYETEFKGISEEELWLNIQRVINETCVERGVDYRYLGHYISQEVTSQPKQTGSMMTNRFFFDWTLCVVMEREGANVDCK